MREPRMVYSLQTRIINGFETQLSPGLVKTHDEWVMGYHEHQHMKWGTPSCNRKDGVNIQYVHSEFSRPLGAINLTKTEPASAQALNLILVNSKT